MQKLMLLIYIFCFISCAGIKTFHVETTPSDADVFIYDSDQKTYIPVGQTPISLDKNIINKYIKTGNDFLALRVQKSGHVVEHIIYDVKTKKKVDYLLQLKAIEMWSDKEGNLSSKLANDIAKKVQYINRSISKKDLDDALDRTNKLIDLYPKAYVFYDIKGSIHLLKGNKPEAISSLQKSLTINPDNVDAINVLNALKQGGGQ